MSNVYYENNEGERINVHYVIMKEGVAYAILDHDTKESMLWDDVLDNYQPMYEGKPTSTFWPLFVSGNRNSEK